MRKYIFVLLILLLTNLCSCKDTNQEIQSPIAQKIVEQSDNEIGEFSISVFSVDSPF